jgi:uncharacterized metal-binding protein YceD (DUF177 family)
MTRAPKAASASEGEAAPFKRQLRVDDIGNDEEGAIQASPAECHAVARMLDLVAVERLDFTYHLRRQASARIALKGRLQAAATQTCILSLEPVESVLDVPVEMEFWLLPLIEELNHQAEDKGHPLREWPEPILEGKIDIGSVIYETFATALDPYPKRQGASLQWQESDAQSDDKEKPEGLFAALAQLKQR